MNLINAVKLLIILLTATLLAAVSFAYGMDTEQRVSALSDPSPAISSTAIAQKTGIPQTPEQTVRIQARCAKLAHLAGFDTFALAHQKTASIVAAANGIAEEMIIYQYGFADGMVTHEQYDRRLQMSRKDIATNTYKLVCPEQA